MVTFDSGAAGTSTEEWTASGRLAGLPALALDAIGRLAVVAAHPDDETLGAGGLIAEATRRGIPLDVIVVTDGSASHPHSSVAAAELASIRSQEVRDAVHDLAPSATVRELRFVDGRTAEDRMEIAAALREAIPSSAAIAAPWRGDGHRDHRVIGELCAALASLRRVPLLEYPIWLWHWGHPDEPSIPWSNVRALRMTHASIDAKRTAISRYVSQVRGPGDDDQPLLRPDFLEHFRRDSEVFVVTRPTRQGTKTESYFDQLYERNSDPWRLSTRWYESRKRAITIASLPRERYGSALEIGCSVGELTALLSERADSLLALDISQAAVEAATERTLGNANVRIEHRDATRDFPDQLFDLIVLSEVGYYWDLPLLRTMAGALVDHLADGGTVLACHWRHPVADYPLGGDEVHGVLRQVPELHRIALHEEEDFVLEVFTGSGESVARLEGLLG